MLSDADRALLTLAARGLSSAEIAEQLDCPPLAIRADLARIIVALGARSRLEALIIAMRLGLKADAR